jgi:hypothetical protein
MAIAQPPTGDHRQNNDENVRELDSKVRLNLKS